MNKKMSTDPIAGEALDALRSDFSKAVPNSENTEGLWRPAITLFLAFTLLTGLVYPLLVTGIAQIVFPAQANGSLVTRHGQLVGSQVVGSQVVGSQLIGQQFNAPRYFWSRPSATTPMPYNASLSGGSNLGPLNPELTDAVKSRIALLRAADPDNPLSVPIDLVTTSASGLDPHISRAAANFQVHRVARARGLSDPSVQALVERLSEGALFGLFGEPRVNVLALNLALDSSTHN